MEARQLLVVSEIIVQQNKVLTIQLLVREHQTVRYRSTSSSWLHYPKRISRVTLYFFSNYRGL